MLKSSVTNCATYLLSEQLAKDLMVIYLEFVKVTYYGNFGKET